MSRVPSLPGGARLFAVLGAPVEHSLSPLLHRAAFREMGLEAAYGALRVETGEVEAVMRALARQGGGNVTLPHKERAARALDRPATAVVATGACNCFWGEGGELAGDNTDVAGFLQAAGALLGAAEDGGQAGEGGDAGEGRRVRPAAGLLTGGEVLLLGAGGAARAVLHGCLRAGVARVDVLNRTRQRAVRMVEEVTTAPRPDGQDGNLRPPGDVGTPEAGGGGPAARSPAEVEVVENPRGTAAPYRLVVNATSLGLERDDPLPLELDPERFRAALDLVYRDGPTAWVRHARDRGIPATDGLEMLVLQAAASLRRWTGREPPLEIMREAARESRG